MPGFLDKQATEEKKCREEIDFVLFLFYVRAVLFEPMNWNQ